MNRPQTTSAEVPTKVRIAATAARERKALDLRALELGEISDFTDYFLVCHGTSRRQVRAIAEAVKDDLKAAGVAPLHIEGLDHGAWVLLDYGDLVVHVFTTETREYYALDKLWSDAPELAALPQ